MPTATAHKRSQGAFYQNVDAAFYSEVKRENGGKLPDNLKDANGNPRKLTLSPKDKAYRKKWLALRDAMTNSRAVPRKSVKEVCIPCMLKAAAALIPPIVLPAKMDGRPVKLQPVGEPATKPVPKHQKQEKIPCKHETLTIACAHAGERGFELQFPGKDEAEGGNESSALEVIDNGREQIVCSTRIVAGVCSPIHEHKVFDVYPDDSVVRKTNSELVFRAVHDEDFDQLSFWDLFNPSRAQTPRQYDIRTQTCQHEQSLSATVLVYPQLDWEIGVSFGWSADETISSLGDGVYELDDSGKWKLSGSVALTQCGKRREFGQEFSRDLKRKLEWAEMAFNAVEFMTMVADKTGTVRLNFIYPTCSIVYRCGWQEIEDSPKCGYANHWEINASPLLGATISVDVLDLLIDIAPFGPALVKIKHAIEEEAKLSLTLAVSGKVYGGFTYNKVITQDAGDMSGNFGGRIIFTLEGDLKSKKFKIFFVNAGGEAKAGAHASFSGNFTAGSDPEGGYYKRFLGFDGLVVYALVAVSASFCWGSKPKEDEEEDEPPELDETDPDQAGQSVSSSKTANEDDGTTRSKSWKKSWIWIDKKTWLGGDEKVYPFAEGE
jgi:hypothetical protein